MMKTRQWQGQWWGGSGSKWQGSNPDFRFQSPFDNNHFSLPTASVHCTHCGWNLQRLFLNLLLLTGTLGLAMEGADTCQHSVCHAGQETGFLVSRFHLFLTLNLHDWVPLPWTPAFASQSTHPWATPCPFHHHWVPSAGAAGDWNFSACLYDIKFVNEVPCLAIIVQSNKASIPAVTYAGTLFPLQRSMGWLPGKYNYVLAQE